MIGSDVTAYRQKHEAFIFEYPNKHDTNSHWPNIQGRSHVLHFAGEVRPEPMLESRPEPQQCLTIVFRRSAWRPHFHISTTCRQRWFCLCKFIEQQANSVLIETALLFMPSSVTQLTIAAAIPCSSAPGAYFHMPQADDMLVCTARVTETGNLQLHAVLATLSKIRQQ